jgi:hypothetical protein
LQVQANPKQLKDNMNDASAALLTPQGSTIKSDVHIQGAKIFSDAWWKTKKVPVRADYQASGIGLFIQLQFTQTSCTLMMEASTNRTPSPLQAEAELCF